MKRIEEILKEIRPEFDFDEHSQLICDGMLDSFDLITLVSDLDKQFNISISGTDIVPEHFADIAAIRKLLETYGVQV